MNNTYLLDIARQVSRLKKQGKTPRGVLDTPTGYVVLSDVSGYQPVGHIWIRTPTGALEVYA